MKLANFLNENSEPMNWRNEIEKLNKISKKKGLGYTFSTDFSFELFAKTSKTYFGIDFKVNGRGYVTVDEDKLRYLDKIHFGSVLNKRDSVYDKDDYEEICKSLDNFFRMLDEMSNIYKN